MCQALSKVSGIQYKTKIKNICPHPTHSSWGETDNKNNNSDAVPQNKS